MVNENITYLNLSKWPKDPYLCEFLNVVS